MRRLRLKERVKEPGQGHTAKKQWSQTGLLGWLFLEAVLITKASTFSRSRDDCPRAFTELASSS